MLDHAEHQAVTGQDFRGRSGTAGIDEVRPCPNCGRTKRWPGGRGGAASWPAPARRRVPPGSAPTRILALSLPMHVLRRHLLLLLVGTTAACSMMRTDNRRTLNALDAALTPASTTAKVALAPVALPVGLAAFAADLTVVHPVASIDDAWDDTADLLWTPRGESTLRKVLFVPVAALATPVVFAADWFGRWLLPIESSPGAEVGP